ncbi:unnamed protein product [Rotaria sp. Silwood1]|nr:unnamed protein product [Rotaria sp. Silwood1]
MSLINDKSKMIPISIQRSSTLENDLKQNSINLIVNESYDENDSEYEDVESEEESNEIKKISVLTSISNKDSSKTFMDEDELHLKVKPRRLNRKRQEDEHSEGYEDDNDNQNVPNIVRDMKKSDKNKEILDDDNNTQSPAYIPRKGEFYEHDDRTLDEKDRSKQEISKNDSRLYRDSDAKWQHDLYFQDEKLLKFQSSSYKQDRNHFEHSNNDDREQLHLNDYISRAQKGHSGYNQQRFYNDYRQRVPQKNFNHSYNIRKDDFDVKDYGRSLSNNHNGASNRNINTYEKPQTTFRQQQQQQQQNNYNPYKIDERIFHRRRNFTNSQIQQQDNVSKLHNNNNNNPNRNIPRRFDEKSNENNQFKKNYEYFNKSGKNQHESQNLKRFEFYENKNNLPPRLQVIYNKRDLIQKQQYQQNPTSNISTDISNIERPKRYSNMRNTMTNSIEQQQQMLSSKIQHYQDQRSNNIELNDWPQAPPPPTSYLPQQNTTSQIFYQQQHAQHIPRNYSPASISQKDEKNEILVISGWLVFEWFDYNLRWKPEDYGGIQSIRLPSTRVWTPDVVLYNSASENFEGTMKTNLVVQSNGTILFVPPGVNLTTNSDTGQLDAYVKNAEWDLEAFIAIRKAFVYECCPTVYPFVLFTIQIRRRTLYYVVNVVVPCVLISFMIVLGFLLPPDSGEKLTLQITILLSIVMFSLLISGIIPASSTALPTIVMYFATVMCLCTMSVIATVFVLVLHHRNAKSHTMPMWVKIYVNQYLAWFLCMSRPEHDLSWRAIRSHHQRTMGRQNSITSDQRCAATPLLANSSKSLLANVTGSEDQTYINTSNTLPTNVTNHIVPRQQPKCKNPHHHHDPNEILLPRDMRVFRSEMRAIISELRILTDHVKKEEDEDDISQDWKFSAMVLDRLCLIVFTILTTLLSYATLFSAKNFFKLR